MRRLLFFALLPLILVLAWFFLKNKVYENEISQDGIVSFDFQGEHYKIPGMELLIYVTSRADRDQIIELPKGLAANFHFAIGESLKKKNGLVNKDKEWLLKNWQEVTI